jgi:hypothetical protein
VTSAAAWPSRSRHLVDDPAVRAGRPIGAQRHEGLGDEQCAQQVGELPALIGGERTEKLLLVRHVGADRLVDGLTP